MNVTFLHHSSFLVEVDDKVLIFDYFDGDKVNGFKFTGKLPEYEPETKIYMFASHCHKDHYDMDILRLAEKYPNIKYILSKDIRISPNFLQKHGINPSVREKVTFVAPEKKYHVDDLNIQTLRSTDAGVAFYVESNGVTLYHAGDLNNWKWDGAGELTNGVQERNFKTKIRHHLSGKPINVAFVPLDTRQGKFMYDGLDFFLQNTDAELVFPMHMWQDYTPIADFKAKISNLGMAERIMEIKRENQVFLIEEK